MILTFAFALPLLTAIVCLALNRLVDTRWLGFGACAALLATAGTLLLGRLRNALTLTEQTWLQLDDQAMTLALGYDAARLPLALLAATGGAVALLALALALPPRLRGYGGLVAALVLLIGGTLVGLAIRDLLLLPLAWAALPLLAFVALRASGGQMEAQALPIGLLSNLVGAILVLGAALSMHSNNGVATPHVALAAMVIAGVLTLGLPPFHRGVRDSVEAPGNVAAPLLAFGLPLLGGATLIRFLAQTPLGDTWRVMLQAFGLLALLVCAAAALRERRLRPLVGWQISAQFGLLLVALGQQPAVLATIAPALLVNIVLVASVALLAVSLIERRAGTDNLNEIRLSGALMLPGLALLVAAGASIGFPATWGFWPTMWLRNELRNSAPVLLGPLLAGAALQACAWVAPVVAFWRAGNERDTASSETVIGQLCPLLAALPLIVFGLAPQLAWRTWGEDAREALLRLAPANLGEPVLPTAASSVAAACALLALVGVLLLRGQTSRRIIPDPELPAAGVMTPDALGDLVRGLGWFGAPAELFARVWQSMIALSRGIGWALSFLEQRYYMAGLLIAVVAVLLLLMQG